MGIGKILYFNIYILIRETRQIHSIKNILLGLAFATITATSVQAEEWKASCNSDYSNPSKGTYIFHVKKGEVGGCDSDSVHQDYGWTKFDWSERAEVKSKRNDLWGKWEWSATIDINRNCIPAHRNTLFQLHSGGWLKSPPSWLGIDRYNRFRTNKNRQDTAGPVPDGPFKLTAIVNSTSEQVDVDYFVNDKFLISTHRKIEKSYNKMYFKFGVYRIKSNCDITQTYTNVKLKRVNPLKEAFNNLSIDKRKNVQINLKSEGFYSSKIDGYYGKNTEKGLKKYNSSFLDAADLKKSVNVDVLLTRLSNVVTLPED